MTTPSPTALFGVFAASELAIAVFKRSGQSAKKADAGSLRLLWGIILCSIAAAVIAAFKFPAARYASPGDTFAIALLVFLAGSIFRWFSVAYLGRFFTADVAIATDHRLIDSGPYRYLRHPSYTGILVQFLGLALQFNNYASLACLVIPTYLAFNWRMDVEEKALLAAFGPRYRDYQARTWRIVPFVY